MRKLFSVLVLVFLLGAGWFSYNFFLPAKVETMPVTRGPAVQAVYATGTVEATVMMPIAARVSARLSKLNVDEGSEVVKDQVLAQLEDEDLQQSLQEKRALEEGARQEFQRQANLVAKRIVSRGAYDKAKADWQSAQAARKMAEAQAQFTKLVAPADGRIIRRDGEIGQLIPANQPVFWMSCCAPLRISAEVDEEDIARVQPGQKVLIRADAFPGEVYEGKVQAITPKGDPVARSYRVRVEFAEETPLMIGMTAETNIVLHETDRALLVPSSAVQAETVWLVKDGRLTKRKVKTGAKGTEQTEIIEGLSEKETVAIHPQVNWQEGDRASERVAK